MQAEYTSMLRSVHAIWGSASAPTAEHQRPRPGVPLFRTVSYDSSGYNTFAGSHRYRVSRYARAGSPRLE
jgi:hypothetical protein